jgi:hypothetical protein
VQRIIERVGESAELPFPMHVHVLRPLNRIRAGLYTALQHCLGHASINEYGPLQGDLALRGFGRELDVSVCTSTESARRQREKLYARQRGTI